MPHFVPRKRKHKHRLQKHAVGKNDARDIDTNQIQILPPSKDEKEEKRRQLKERLRAEQPIASSKKLKRLDKYIENKLKKDENLDLLQRLSQAKFDTSQLQSSKHLGKRKHAQFATDSGLWKRDDTHTHGWQDHSSDSDLESADSLEVRRAQSLNARTENGHEGQDPPSKPAIMQGSGLKSPLAVGEDGLPVFYAKKKKARRKSEEEESWQGFSSESTVEGVSPIDSTDVHHRLSAADSGPISAEHPAEAYHASSAKSNSSGYESNEDNHPGHQPKIVPRTSAFKSWATQQINTCLGHVPFSATDYTLALKPATAPTKPTVSKPAPDDATQADERKNGLNGSAYNVPVARSMEIEEARAKLPIVADEQKIMEAVYNSPCVIIWGATGSGKTTQVPQFLFEAGYGSPDGPAPGLIGITQPRRVAAVSTARRVGQELGQHVEKVSYQIRFETTSSKDTAIKYMTDGILLREISQDFALLKYSIVIIDEAHERSVNTDILIGMLSRIVDLRGRMSSDNPSTRPLKLVIMSATLRVSDFLQRGNLFPTRMPPVVQAEGRQFPVTMHFARRTERDYLDEAYRKISLGHRKLPPGGLLVFLTGQNEIKLLLKRLQDPFPSSNRAAGGSMKVQFSANEAPLEIDDLELSAAQERQTEEEEDSDVGFVGHDGEDEDMGFDVGEPASALPGVHILPLYSQLPTNEQLRVFEPPPKGSRLVVLATNVAETSLTIPGIRYVFDCGRSKERMYDPSTGIQRFEVNWISKASAEQRAGRAGRTGPGHCYRLYSSAVYERDFAEHAEPEILRTPVENVVLQMKTMGIDNVVNFPFPTPPDRNRLTKAERLLQNLGALTPTSQVTPLGRSLSMYPLSPRYGKMLAIGSQHGCLPYVIGLVSGLAVGDVFVPEPQLDLGQKGVQEKGVYTNEDRLEDTARERRRKEYNKARAIFSNQDPTSDALKLLSAVCAYAYTDDEEAFCKEMFLRSKALKEISQLRKQLTDIVRANHTQSIGLHTARLQPPTQKQVKALNQIVAASFIDQVALRADLSPTPPVLPRGKPKRAIDVPYFSISQTTATPTTTASRAASNDQAIYLHPSSILARLSPKDLPQYLIYSHLQQSSPSVITSDKKQQQHGEEDRHDHASPKIRMYSLTAIGGAQLSALAHDTPLLSYGKPIGKVSLLSSAGGGGVPERRECWVVPSLRNGDGGAGGGIGWPLPAKKVVQRKDAGGTGRAGGWVIERFLS